MNGQDMMRSIVIGATLLVPSALIAEVDTAKQLLSDAWGARPEHRKMADALFLGDRYSDDTGYAYALVLFRQNRFNMARTVLDALLERLPIMSRLARPDYGCESLEKSTSSRCPT